MDMIKVEGATLMKKGFGRIDERRSTKELITIYNKYLMPLLRTTERQNYDWLIKNGYGDVLKHIRFCRKPLLTGEPCGVCDPCIHKILANMNELIPERSMKNFQKYESLYGQKDDAGFDIDEIFKDFLNEDPFRKLSDLIPLVMNVQNKDLFHQNLIEQQNQVIKSQKKAIIKDIAFFHTI